MADCSLVRLGLVGKTGDCSCACWRTWSGVPDGSLLYFLGSLQFYSEAHFGFLIQICHAQTDLLSGSRRPSHWLTARAKETMPCNILSFHRLESLETRNESYLWQQVEWDGFATCQISGRLQIKGSNMYVAAILSCVDLSAMLQQDDSKPDSILMMMPKMSAEQSLLIS